MRVELGGVDFEVIIALLAVVGGIESSSTSGIGKGG